MTSDTTSCQTAAEIQPCFFYFFYSNGASVVSLSVGYSISEGELRQKYVESHSRCDSKPRNQLQVGRVLRSVCRIIARLA